MKKEEKKKSKKAIIVIVVILIIAAIIIFYKPEQPQQQRPMGKCLANQNFNSTQLTALGKTLSQINTYCSQGTDETACKEKVFYVIGEPLDANKTRYHYIYSESSEVQAGREYKGKIIDICLWSLQ